MEVYLFLVGEPGEGGYIVDDAVREVWGAADEEDGVWIDKAGYRWRVDFVGGCWAGY